jgi:hypothetical protein
MGAYKYVDIPTGWFEQGTFRMEQTTTPPERELLTRVLEVLQKDHAEYTRQIETVKLRLAQLR